MGQPALAALMSHSSPPRDPAADQADHEALERCLAGDRQAFAELVGRHGSGVLGLCVRMVRPAVGEELAQETFAKAYASLDRFRRDAQFRHWLYRIALNLCRDHLKAGRSRELATDFGAVDFAGGTPAQDERASNRQTLRALEQAIERLPEKYREAFVLKHLEHLSYEEIAEIAKVEVGALKVRVHRAREMLRGMLGELLE